MREYFTVILAYAGAILVAGIVLGTFWFAYEARIQSITNKADIQNIVNYINNATKAQPAK